MSDLIDRLIAQRQFAWQSPLLDEIRAKLERLERCEADYQVLWDKLRKTEVVAEYAQHYAGCQFLESGIGHPMPCTCGLSAANIALEGK